MGTKKLRDQAASSYAGLSDKKKILQVTNNESKYRVHNARFTNKATRKPVTAKRLQSQHQIDLIDLSKDPVKHNGKVYKYILSVIDVFSRFLWLVPMERKSSRQVVRSLRPIYDEHGPPDRLQSDRGPEFQGKLRSLCTHYKIKMIKSRPYHPQSQGKVERSHRRLRTKIMYDLISLEKKGVNWASNLGSYNRILNEESKEEQGWKSPFEIYFGRKSNILVKAALEEEETDTDHCIIAAPKRKDYQRHFSYVIFVIFFCNCLFLRLITNHDNVVLQFTTARIITNCDNRLLQFTIGTLLQFTTTVITIHDRYYNSRRYYNLRQIMVMSNFLFCC